MKCVKTLKNELSQVGAHLTKFLMIFLDKNLEFNFTSSCKNSHTLFVNFFNLRRSQRLLVSFSNLERKLV